MVEPTNELILEILRRMGSFEIRMAHMELQIVELSVRMDRRDEQMEHILRRREFTDQPH